jgi:excisionase family DNA binding protein
MRTLTNSIEADTKPAKKTQKEKPTLPPVSLTTEQLAARWHVTGMTLRRWRAAGRLPVLRVGPRRIVFSLADVERFEEQSRA